MTTFVKTAALFCGAALLAVAARADSLPPDATYRSLPTQPLSAVKAADETQKPQVMQRQRALLEERYDISNQPIPNSMMSGRRKPVQGGVRVKLPAGSPGMIWRP
jgi:hypothetical protein